HRLPCFQNRGRHAGRPLHLDSATFRMHSYFWPPHHPSAQRPVLSAHFPCPKISSHDRPTPSAQRSKYPIRSKTGFFRKNN
ncbi:MAG: hypothetical protein WD267_04010, partial [Balneolales bacterium]